MALGSKSDFFSGLPKEILLGEAREKVVQELKSKLYPPDRILNILEAYDYMVENPKSYDGSTASQDLFDIIVVHEGKVFKLEIASVPHDYYYIIGGFYSKKLLRMLDKMLKIDMLMFSKSGFEISKRISLLFILREIVNYAFWKRLIDKKKVSDEIYNKIQNIYKTY